MPVIIALWCVAALLALACLGVVTARRRAGTALVYGGCLATSTPAFFVALRHLIAGGATSALVLPLGLPWVGSHFRVDLLAAFFLAVVNLGAGSASCYALGYGRHEAAPQRVLPFYPAFLAGMNLVVLADDAFTFLLSWEFMSLSSWALVMAHHREADNARAGYIYLVMASFGTLALLLAFDLLGEPGWWSSMVVLVLAAATALLGVLYALMQHDLKRLLAYHTVENIGIIFIGLGLALAFRANGMGGAAALAFTAALFHVLNHSLFKSLLFFGAGAVLTGTGERDMERLGGLIHRMPLASFAFLVGCVAISALPPLNGFVSEWLTFQAILLSPALPQWGLKILIPSVGAVLALSAALAAACFVKAFGVTFLGRPRSPVVAKAGEADHFSLAAMLFLAALCLLAGILPGFVIDALAPLTQSLVGVL